MKKTRLRKYARLIASVGVNVRRGQEVYISAEVDQPDFVAMVAEECYRLGASKVTVDFTYQPLDRLHTKYCTDEVLADLDGWQIEKWEHQAKILPCKIYLLSEDPDGLCGIDQKKYAKAKAAKAIKVKPIRSRMENKYQWCIAAVPSVTWAKKLFPQLRAGAAVERLWEAILDTSRVHDDPVLEWKMHNESFLARCERLNSMNLRKLHYTAKNGTDLWVSLIPEALFCGGGESTESGVYFNPNIPTEEIFTSPMKDSAEGVVYSSMPLSYGGQVIDNFHIRFEGGRAVEWHAERGEELLGEIITADDGAARLGECALVPYSSPINASGILFYNTLFDENACCHLALGRGFDNCVRDYEKYSQDELRAMGVNDSMIHVDFMIGSDDLEITGITEDGREVEIFRNGVWCF